MIHLGLPILKVPVNVKTLLATCDEPHLPTMIIVGHNDEITPQFGSISSHAARVFADLDYKYWF